MPLNIELDSALAGKLVAVAGLAGTIDAVESLSGGMGSAVFAVRVDGVDVVIKIYPDVVRAAMQKELWVCGFLAQRAPSLPLPKVLAVDESGELIPQAFSVLTRVPGVHLRSQLDVLSRDDVLNVYRDMGSTLRALHGVELPEFGEVMPDRGTRYASNRAFMLAQFEQNLATFAGLGGDRELHRRLEAFVGDRQELLDVEHAAFCHNDGHDANILVARSETGWRLSGILDFELALASDPLLDVAKSYYFAPFQTEDLLAALTEHQLAANSRSRDTFDLYLVYHQLQLWNLLARLNVSDRLPRIAADLNHSLPA